MSDGSPPLDGVRVLELGSFIAGPFAGQLLGDLGADVVKIEPPGTGDPMRKWGILDGGRSLWWPAIARNKRSVAVDLRDARGRDIVRRLLPHVDVVLENFKPGTLDRWGLGYEALAAINPAVLLVHVSGYGQTGPRAHEPGFGAIGEAVGGIRFTTGEPDRRPARTGISLGDSLAALFAVIGTLERAPRADAQRARAGGRRRDRGGGLRPHGVDRRRLRARWGRPAAQRGSAHRGGAVERVPDGRRTGRRDRGQRGRGVRPAVCGDGPPGARDRGAVRAPRGPGRRARPSSTTRSRPGPRASRRTTCWRDSTSTRCRRA